NKDGATSADLARRRGQDQVAAVLDAAVSGKSIQGDRPEKDALEGLAKDLASAFESEDAEALQRLNRFRGRSLSREDLRAEVWHRVYKVRQAKGRPGCFDLADAKEFLAREAGFGNWTAFVNAGGVLLGEPYTIQDRRIAPRRQLSEKDWDELI